MNQALGSLIFMLAISSCLAHIILKPGQFAQVELSGTKQTTFIIDVPAESSETYLLNIEWYPRAATEHQGAQFKPIPVPEIKVRKDGEVWRQLSAELSLLDLNLWVVSLEAGSYSLELGPASDGSASRVSLAVAAPGPLSLHTNQTLVARVAETADRFRISVDMLSNQLEYRDSFAIEIWVCKGKILDFEVQYVKSGLSMEKVRKSEFPTYHGPRGYLIAHDVRKDAKEYVFDFFKRQSKVIHEGDIILKMRLWKLPRTSKPNLASLHQALGNEEYPGGLKLATQSSKDIVQVSLKPDEYMLRTSGLLSPLIYGYYVYGPTSEVIFRKQCGFDKSILFGSSSTTFREKTEVPSDVRRPLQKLAGYSLFGRLVITDGYRLYLTDSGIIDLHTGVIMENSNGPGTGNRQIGEKNKMQDTAYLNHAYSPQQTDKQWNPNFWLIIVGGSLLIMSIFAARKLFQSADKRSVIRKQVLPELDPEELQTITKPRADDGESVTKQRGQNLNTNKY